MDMSFFLFTFFVLQVVCLFISNREGRKIKSQEDYFLAGKGVRFFPLMMTFVATQIGGGIILGSSEEAYQYGWIALLYPVGQALGFIVLALGVGKKMAEFQVSTVAQLFEVVYKSVKLKKIASLLSIISLFMILIAQIIASKKFMLSVGIEENIIFIGFWSIVIIYTVIGGLGAVIATDLIQALFFTTVFLGCFAYVLFSNDFSFSSVVAAGLPNQGFDWSQSKFSGWLLLPLLFMVIEQDMAQRCFAAKSGKTVSWAAGGAAISVLCICVIPIFFGVLAKALGLVAETGSSIFMDVIQMSTNPQIAGFVGCSIFVAIISTADSLINAISSNLTQDFTKKMDVRVLRGVTAGIAITAIFFSFYFNNIVDVLIQSYELSVSCLFVPVLAALIKRIGCPLSAGMAMAFGAAGFILFRIFEMPLLPKELVSIGISFIGFVLGELFSQVNRKKVSLI